VLHLSTRHRSIAPVIEPPVTGSCILATVVLVQKLLAPRAVVDVSVALAIVTLEIVVTVAPSAVPGLT
jgi:hypothetical protein